MLTINLIRENSELVIKKLKVKNLDVTNIVEQILKLDRERRELLTLTESLQADINRISKEIGSLMKSGDSAAVAAVKDKTQSMKEEIRSHAAHLADIEVKLNEEIVKLPNLPHDSVPPGKGAEQNLVVREGGKITNLPEGAKAHWDLIKEHNIIDFELGTKITGAGFPVYLGKGARLQRALINFFLDEGTRAGYHEVQPPVVVNEDSGFGTGQLPDKDGQMYHVGIDNLYLIPTAEVPVTNLYRDVILDESQLPVKNISYTPCFRREAGSWGAHVRGLNRLHQFDKVEIVQITTRESSYNALEEMAEHVEGLIIKLGLPYRILKLCGGDISFTSALTYDFEVWSAGQKRWLEVSSVSNFETFQANRLKCRYRIKGEKQTRMAHTLNGSALALPRIVAALLENNQTPDGIRIPGILVPYTGFEII
ncbi:MAG: serine--tRNA ligase [Bacteroidales bacterium]